VTTVAPKPIVTRPWPVRQQVKGSALARILRTTDAKQIGIMYMITAFVFYILGGIMVLLVMEGLRRVAGMFLFFVVVAFIAYGLMAHLVPAPLTGSETNLRAMVNYLAFDINALLGTPLVVATSIVVLFIFLGQTLFVSGGGEFFTDIAMATMGGRRGGAAKISVVASALWHFEPTLDKAIANVKSGFFKAENYGIYSFMKEGGCSLAPLGTFEGKVPAEAMAKVAEKEAAIKAGTFIVEINDTEPKSS